MPSSFWVGALLSTSVMTGACWDIVREFAVRQKWIFAICHGIQILAAAGLTKGKRVTCYGHVRLDAEQAGGTF